MSYISQILQPGETLLHVARLHWMIYLRGLVLFSLAVAVNIWTTTAAATSGLFPTLLGIDGLLMLASLISLGSAWLRRWSTEIAVTDKRVVFKTRLIRRHTVEMNMSKVESVDVNQSVFGRMFNYGDVVVRGTGSGLEPIRDVAGPLDLRNHITGH